MDPLLPVAMIDGCAETSAYAVQIASQCPENGSAVSGLATYLLEYDASSGHETW
jgi:hypothetical protein